MVVSAGKKADLQRVDMLSSLREISMYFFCGVRIGVDEELLGVSGWEVMGD